MINQSRPMVQRERLASGSQIDEYNPQILAEMARAKAYEICPFVKAARQTEEIDGL
jgi:hypothetical protein